MTRDVGARRLGDVADLNPKLVKKLGDDEEVSFVSMSALNADTATTDHVEYRNYVEVRKGYTSFLDEDILVAKITPCFENGKIGRATLPTSLGFGSTEFHVVRPRSGLLEGKYLLHFLRQPWIRRDGERKMTGSAGQRRVPIQYLKNLIIPLPPLSEQQRIAAVLDQADALRAKRRETLAELDELIESVFVDVFGSEGSQCWEEASLADLSISLRNGLSPSSDGDVCSDVLTLSAVTGERFNAAAVKRGVFRGLIPVDKFVDPSDFLICRGNGNINLVGRGHFAREIAGGVIFPDTIIAARMSARVDRKYLATVWRTRQVRSQIVAAARTTNGTFKVNQRAIGKVKLPLPPLDLQREFARRVEVIERMKETQRAHLAELDALFASLQDRAFRGEL